MTPDTMLDCIKRMNPVWIGTPIEVADQRALHANLAWWQDLPAEDWRTMRDYCNYLWGNGKERKWLPRNRHRFIEEGGGTLLTAAKQHACNVRAKQILHNRKPAPVEYRQAIPGTSNHEAIEVRSEPPASLAEAIEANWQALEAICGRKRRTTRL